MIYCKTEIKKKQKQTIQFLYKPRDIGFGFKEKGDWNYQTDFELVHSICSIE